MCKHVLNAQFMIWTGKQWYDCVLCHAEDNGGKPFVPSGTKMSLRCKKCSKVFRKDFSCFSSHDHKCPHCGHVLFLDARFPTDEEAEARGRPTPVRDAAHAAMVHANRAEDGNKLPRI